MWHIISFSEKKDFSQIKSLSLMAFPSTMSSCVAYLAMVSKPFHLLCDFCPLLSPWHMRQESLVAQCDPPTAEEHRNISMRNQSHLTRVKNWRQLEISQLKMSPFTWWKSLCSIKDYRNIIRSRTIKDTLMCITDLRLLICILCQLCQIVHFHSKVTK